MTKIHVYSFTAAVLGFAGVLTGDTAYPAANPALAPMPEAVTSFGAVTHGEWLYVFGGHKGERHDYSAQMVSGSFYRLNLDHGQAWEALAAATPAQGMPLVAHGGSIYRIGGMAARNAADAKQDLHSMALTQRFDPRQGRWDDLAPLPEPRSSHDAVVIGDKLYVAGGWRVSGSTSNAFWPTNALVLDLAQAQPAWKEFPQPFQRRALALAAVGPRLFCIGGMDSDNKPTLAVEIYDTSTGQWSRGADLPPGKHKGFGCSAIAQAGRVYVTAFQGDLLRLTSDERSWEVVGRLEHPRVAHRLVTAGAAQLIALGGEDGEDKRPDLEVLTPSGKALVTEKPVGPRAQAAAQANP